jgi:hypothetical protein
VSDVSGAALPGAAVTLLGEETGFRRFTVSDHQGRYIVAFLAPGTYRLTVSRAGFQAASRRGVQIRAGRTVRLDVALSLRRLEATVTVTGSERPPPDEGGPGARFDGRSVEALPLNGRSLQPILELVPGTVLSRTSALEQGQFSVNGQRANANSFEVDGVSANVAVFALPTLGQAGGGSLPALTAAGGTNALVSVEALEEVRVGAPSYAAEHGRLPGARVSLTTRSGTDEWHGAAFEYFRHDALDAGDWFAQRHELPQPALRQSHFGGVLGGPLVRGRTFVFLSYEGLRLHQPRTAVTEVPSRPLRELAPESVQPMLGAFPVPVGSPRIVLSSFSASYSDPSELNVASLRLDQALGRRGTLFVRGSLAPSGIVQRGAGDSLNTVKYTRLSTASLTAGVRLKVGSAAVNHLRANWSRNRADAWNELDGFGGASPPDPALFPAPLDDALYSFRIGGPGSSARLLYGRSARQVQRQVHLADALSIAAGRHQVELGVDFRQLDPVYDPFRFGEEIEFVRGGWGDPDTAGTVLSGTPRNVWRTFNPGTRRPRFLSLAAFVQDTWRANGRLLLSYGLRWELAPAPRESAATDTWTLTGVDPSTMAVATPGTPLWRTRYANLAPRLSAAFDVWQRDGWQTTLRGGFGVFYDVGHSAAGAAYAAGVTPYSRRVAVPSGADPGAATRLQVAFDPRLQLPYTVQWNLGLEQTLDRHHRLALTYLGAAGRRLLIQQQQVLVNTTSGWSVESLFTNAGRSDYHALQVQLQRPLHRGLALVASYRWAHAIDTGSDESGVFAPVPGTAEVNGQFDPRRNRGDADFDIRHTASAAVSLDGRGLRGGLGRLLRDWSLTALVRARSAPPVNVVVPHEPFGSVRPHLIGPPYLADPGAPGGRRLNPAAFKWPWPGRQGSMGRNTLRGFPASQVDLAIRREIPFSKRLRLQVGVDVFNLLNQSNFGPPETNLGSDQFGESTSLLGASLGGGGREGGFSPLYQMGGPRSLQLVARLQF